MSYVALYRKYRPNTFDDIVGQENVTKILKNQIKTGKISHAYIFSGSRGTGKTSAAKVFARAINCLNPHDGEPCNECDVCKNILEGNITDVIEMDAASNNSVDNIRQIRQEVVYATIDVKYRVYIIDEVHMLTTSAFNALLKTLEEPPENVVFILATTEQHKIPVTILSRCLRFEFNRIPDEEIMKRLEYVLKEEAIQYEKEALIYIAKLAEGGLRDALSVLDRCISETHDVLKFEDVQRIVGAIDKEIVESLVENINLCNSVGALEKVEIVIQKGKDLRQLVYQLTEAFLDKLISDCQTDSKEQTKLIQIIDRLSKLDNDLRQTTKPTIVLKACMVEICHTTIGESDHSPIITDDGPVNQQIIQKINHLEQEIEKLNLKLKTNSSVQKTVETHQNPAIQTSKVKEENTLENLVPFKELDNFKKMVVEQGKLKLYSALAGAQLFIAEHYVVIMTNNAFAYNILKLEDSIASISQILNDHYQIDKEIHLELQEKNEKNEKKIEKLFKENDINYTPLD